MGEPQELGASLRHEISMLCRDRQNRPHLLTTVFTYAESEPFAVTIVFRTRGMSLPWTFARDLLIRGQRGPAGEGDVRVWPDHDSRGAPTIRIRLSSPDGELIVEAPAAEVRSFVDATLRRVPLGHEGEHLDMDQLVADLLSAG